MQTVNGTVQNGVSGRLINNPYLENHQTEDSLHHLGISNVKNNLPKLFGDVKFVCLAGTAHRVKKIAKMLQQELHPISKQDKELVNLSKSAHRFSMFKVGSVLCVNHGMGFPSVTILLHEILRLLYYAGVEDPIIFRLGTCGGINIPNGAVVISEKVTNEFFQESYEQIVIGRRETFPAKFDQNLVSHLKTISSSKCPDIPIVTGKIMSTEHFYECVASKSSSICTQTDAERENFHQLLIKNEILCMDMEALAVAAITNQLKIKSAVVLVSTNHVLQHSVESASAEIMEEWEKRPIRVVIEYIKKFNHK